MLSDHHFKNYFVTIVLISFSWIDTYYTFIIINKWIQFEQSSKSSFDVASIWFDWSEEKQFIINQRKETRVGFIDDMHPLTVVTDDNYRNVVVKILIRYWIKIFYLEFLWNNKKNKSIIFMVSGNIHQFNCTIVVLRCQFYVTRIEYHFKPAIKDFSKFLGQNITCDPPELNY